MRPASAFLALLLASTLLAAAQQGSQQGERAPPPAGALHRCRCCAPPPARPPVSAQACRLMFDAPTCKGGGWAQAAPLAPSRRWLAAGACRRPARTIPVCMHACMPCGTTRIAQRVALCVLYVRWLAGASRMSLSGWRHACGAVLLARTAGTPKQPSGLLLRGQLSKCLVNVAARCPAARHQRACLLHVPPCCAPYPQLAPPPAHPCSHGSAVPAQRHQQLGHCNSGGEWSGLAGGQQPLRQRWQRRVEGSDVWWWRRAG